MDQTALSYLDTLLIPFVHSILNVHTVTCKKVLNILDDFQCVSFPQGVKDYILGKGLYWLIAF